MHIAIPIINKTATNTIIPKSILNVPPISPNKDTIFLSANGSQIACAKLYVIVSTISLIIGIIQIPIIIIIPTIPIEFFKIDVAPSTISVESLKAFPTTGTRLDDIAFILFAAIPSILLVKFPSKDNKLTKAVTITPKVHEIPDFKNLDNFPVCILSDKLDNIEIAVATYAIGRIKSVIEFAIKIMANNINGSISVTVAIFPRSRHKC